MNADQTEYVCFNKEAGIYALNGGCLKLVDSFTYLGKSDSSTESDIHMHLAKAWNAMDRLSIIWKSDLSDKKYGISSEQRLCQYNFTDVPHGLKKTYSEKSRRKLNKNA